MFQRIREDVRMVFDRDPAARGVGEVMCCYPGLHAIWLHRVAHVLWRKKLRFFARLLSHVNRLITGIEIHPGAYIGRRLFIDHGAAVVIGETSEIGDDVTIYQGVVLGGVSLEKGKRHPTIGNNVVIGAGGIILGPVTIGDGCQIGAGSVVVTDIPPCTTAIGIPAKPAGKHQLKEPVDLNHHLMPDPVKETLDRLVRRIEKLEEQVDGLGGVEKGRGRNHAQGNGTKLMKGSIASVNISDTKGESKTPVQEKVALRPGWGMVGDCHAGTPGRDVSLLPREVLRGVPYGGYGENIDTAGIDILRLAEGTVLAIGDGIRLQITQRGKTCTTRCSIYYTLGNCIMQEKGVFAAVLEGGEVGVGDAIRVEGPPSSVQQGVFHSRKKQLKGGQGRLDAGGDREP